MDNATKYYTCHIKITKITSQINIYPASLIDFENI